MNKEDTFAISNFVRRQTKESRFSYYDGTENELLDLIKSNANDWVAGYRDGVALIPVPPENFFSGIVLLAAGDRFEGRYEARQEGEEPRKATWAIDGKKAPAKVVELVMYSHDVLVENNEQSSDADWELISINASPTEEAAPIPVEALLANHFQVSGGTSTNMTAQEFETELRKSFLWWRDKGMAGLKSTAMNTTVYLVIASNTNGTPYENLYGDEQVAFLDLADAEAKAKELSSDPVWGVHGNQPASDFGMTYTVVAVENENDVRFECQGHLDAYRDLVMVGNQYD